MLTYRHAERRASQEEDLVTALAIAYSLIPEGHPEEDHLDALLCSIAEEFDLDPEAFLEDLRDTGIRPIE